MDVEIKGLKKIQGALKDYPNISEPILQKAVNATGAILNKNTTKENVPWRTGMLCQTFGWEIGKLWTKWFPTRNYGVYVNARNPFMQRILDKSQPDINEVFKNALGKITEEISNQSK
ncbi:MAG: hypothetical protein WC472_01600 [Candidatus Paceibacterota bacterium]